MSMNLQRCRGASVPRNRWPNRRSVAVQCSQQRTAMASKRAAAQLCVERFVKDGSILALGPGEMVNLVIEEVGRRLATGSLQGVVGVPMCDVAAHEAAFQGLPLLPEARAGEASLVLAEADQLDPSGRAVVLGVASEPQQPDLPRLLPMLRPGGPPLVLLTESNRVVTRLCGVLPVALRAENWEEWAEQLDDIFLGDAELWRRAMTGAPDSPRGGDFPYVSPQGDTIVDIRFYEGFKLYGEDEPYDKIAAEISGVSGVLGHGLLVGQAAAVVVAAPPEGGEPQVLGW